MADQVGEELPDVAVEARNLATGWKEGVDGSSTVRALVEVECVSSDCGRADRDRITVRACFPSAQYVAAQVQSWGLTVRARDWASAAISCKPDHDLVLVGPCGCGRGEHIVGLRL